MRWKLNRYIEDWPSALFFDGVGIICTGLLIRFVLPFEQDPLLPAICFGGFACIIATIGKIVRKQSD